MSKLITVLVLTLASLTSMQVAVAGDDATGECKAICSLPVDLASAN